MWQGIVWRVTSNGDIWLETHEFASYVEASKFVMSFSNVHIAIIPQGSFHYFIKALAEWQADQGGKDETDS